MGFVWKMITNMAVADALPISHLLPDRFQILYMNYFYQALAQVQIWAV